MTAPLLTLWFVHVLPFLWPTPLVAAAPTPAPITAPLASGRWTDELELSGEIGGKPASGSLLVYLPAGYVEGTAKRWPLVVALHGWNHSPALFRDKGDLARHADAHQVVIAVPKMVKSIYETDLHGSKKTGLAMPGTPWVGEVVLPWLRQRFAVYGDRAHTAVIGYSTGGRGAVLLAAIYPEFAFAGSLSGTFDLFALQPKEGEYKIHAAVYGPRKKHADDWRADDIVTRRLDNLVGTRLFVGHGAGDKSVNPNQLAALQKAIAGKPIVADFVLVPGAVHDWAYWTSQWDAVFAAMDKAFSAGVAPR